MVRPAERRARRYADRRGQPKKRLTAGDLYELFVGEIGITRREFLYDIRFWEARRIIRGHRRRNRLEQQLLRLNAYLTCFTFRENKQRKTPQDWLPLPWEDSDQDRPQVTDQEAQELIDFMKELNARGGM